MTLNKNMVGMHYLKPMIKGELLIWRWFLSFLIFPLTSDNIAECRFKVMQSYVQNPQIHAQAV